jgi:putative membrane protein
MHGYGGMWAMGGPMIASTLLTVLLVGLTVWLVIRYAVPRYAVNDNASARRILSERYARGELDTDEYAQRRAQLR